MDVLLVNSNITRCGRSGYGPTPAPAGLISLAGVLKRHGQRVRICQAEKHVLPQDEADLPLLRGELEAILDRGAPDVVGISVRNVGALRRPANPFRLVQYYSAFYDARLVRAFRMLCDAPIVIGGTAFSIEPGLYLKYVRPDFGILGEAEESLPGLLDCLAEGREPAGVAGLVTDARQAAPEGRTYARVADLAAAGVGACDTVEDFGRHYYEAGGMAPVQTKRGCPMRCAYCTAPCVEGRAYRLRPLAHVIDEIRAYRQACGVRHFFIVDATFNHPLGHALEVCDAILQADLDIEWFAEMTPAAVSDELCRLMVRSGCTGVTLTPDSACESVLKSYGKRFGTAEVRNAIALLKKHRIPFDTCMILGGPGETRETLAETIEFCTEHLRDDVVRFYDGMVVTTISPSYRTAVEEGLIDPARPYEDVVLENDFRGIRGYHYYFPHVQEGRDELLALVDEVCRGRRWLLTSRDYVPDAVTGELALSRQIRVRPGARPWWRGLQRQDWPTATAAPAEG